MQTTSQRATIESVRQSIDKLADLPVELQQLLTKLVAYKVYYGGRPLLLRYLEQETAEATVAKPISLTLVSRSNGVRLLSFHTDDFYCADCNGSDQTVGHSSDQLHNLNCCTDVCYEIYSYDASVDKLTVDLTIHCWSHFGRKKTNFSCAFEDGGCVSLSYSSDARQHQHLKVNATSTHYQLREL